MNSLRRHFSSGTEKETDPVPALFLRPLRKTFLILLLLFVIYVLLYFFHDLP